MAADAPIGTSISAVDYPIGTAVVPAQDLEHIKPVISLSAVSRKGMAPERVFPGARWPCCVEFFSRAAIKSQTTRIQTLRIVGFDGLPNRFIA